VLAVGPVTAPQREGRQWEDVIGARADRTGFDRPRDQSGIWPDAYRLPAKAAVVIATMMARQMTAMMTATPMLMGAPYPDRAFARQGPRAGGPRRSAAASAAPAISIITP
jgi:hypothetical protein